MKQNNFTYLLTITLTLITLTIVVVAQTNNMLMLGDIPELVMYGLLTAFALYFSVQLSHGELSMAHVVGMMAFLAYPASATSIILLVIFVGGLGGGFLMALRAFLQSPSQRRVRANLNTLVYVTARVTVSYFVATTIYMQSGGSLPLNDVNDAISITQLTDTIAALILFAAVYIGIYTAIFALQLYAEDYPITETFRDNFAAFIVILFAPVPFAILAAVSPSANTSIVSFAIVVAGTMFSIFGLHAISRVTWRVQKQLDEMSALSRISQAMTGSLNLKALYPALYKQIQPMMNIENMKVVLYIEDTKVISYDYIIQDGTNNKGLQHSQPDDHNLVQRVLVTRQALRLQDNVQEQAMVNGLIAPGNLTSWLGVPLLSGKNIIGALVVSSYTDNRHFDTVDEHLLVIIAGTASIAIENAQLYEQKSQRAEQLATLNKIATLLSGTLSSEDIIDIVISSASTITDANAVALYLPSAGTKNRLQFVKSAGLSEQFNDNPWQPQLGDLVSNSSKEIGQLQPIIVENIDVIDNHSSSRTHALAEKKRAWVELPLHLGNNNFGVIVAYYDEPQTFTPEHIGVLETFATQATQAINNAQAYAITDEALEGRIEQLYALATMGRMLNATMDSKTICDIVLSYASDVTQAERGFVALYRQGSRKVDLCSIHDYDKSLITIDNLSQGLNHHIMETRRAFRSDDIRLETGYLPMIPDTRSLLIVPFIRGNDFWGLIRLESTALRAFTEGDVHYVSQIANQALIAMDNTSLFQRIRNARDSLQTILDGMEDGIMMIDAKHIVTIANPPIKMLGLNPDKVIRKPIDTLIADESLNILRCLGFKDKNDLMQVLNHLNHSNQWRNQLTHEYDLASIDGTRTYIKRLLIPVREEDTQATSGVLMVFYDKTEEHNLTQARDALSQMIVHDLRSPLTAVTTSLALLKAISSEDDKLNAIIDKTTNASQQAIQKVLSRINSLLDISKMESDEITIHAHPSEFATIVDNVLIELSPLAHVMDITLRSDISESLPLLHIDSDKVERVLQNLVDNAIKYSPRDSYVILRASRHDISDTGSIQIDIIDSGPGIPDEYKAAIFNRYTQVKGRDAMRGGVGLGLAFCRMVAEAHGEQIWVEDNPEGGSIFSLTLPIATQTEISNAS